MQGTILFIKVQILHAQKQAPTRHLAIFFYYIDVVRLKFSATYPIQSRGLLWKASVVLYLRPLLHQKPHHHSFH